MKKVLFIYNEGEDGPSNVYLNMLRKTAEEKDVDIMVSDSLEEIEKKIGEEKEEDERFENNFGVLVMQPFSNINMIDVRDFFSLIGFDHDIDNVTNHTKYTSATAQGIYDFIKMLYPYREDAIVGVIGRGVVGKALLDMLIHHGYTVVEVNSATDVIIRDELLQRCNVVVGLSSVDNVLDDKNRDMIDSKLPGAPTTYIDAGRNFAFTNKANVYKCGKWTRNVLISRI